MDENYKFLLRKDRSLEFLGTVSEVPYDQYTPHNKARFVIGVYVLPLENDEVSIIVTEADDQQSAEEYLKKLYSE